MACCTPERILLCIDAFEEPYVSKHPIVQGGRTFTTFNIIQNCAEIFLMNKSALNPNHLFSLVIVKGTSRKIFPFTNNLKTLITTVRSLATEPAAGDHQLHLSQYLNVLDAEEIRSKEISSSKPIRLVLLFGRPGVCIKDENVPPCNNDIIIDIVYFHKPFHSAKEKKRIKSNLSVLQSCVSEHSICKVVLAFSLNAFVEMADVLVHPQMRV